MKDPKKMKNLGTERTLFLEELSDLVADLHFRGPIAGEPVLPKTHEKLSLEEITRIQLMMGFADRAALTLELGANPAHTHRDISLRQLNDAYEQVHGSKVHKKTDELLDQYGAPKNSRKHRPTKN